MRKKNTKKINYYNLSRIDKHQAPYKIILSTRSDGKSYAVKHRAIEQAWKDPDKNKLILLRRYFVDLDSKLGDPKKYFKDVKVEEITDGKYNHILIHANNIYLANIEKETGKTKRGIIIGYVMALSSAEHYKSSDYTDVGTVIYEEFITKGRYINDEPTELMHLISTISRQDDIQVYLVGNTISRLCPYFREWQLVNIPSQKPGTVDIYLQETGRFDDDNKPIVVRIAVEYAEPAGNNNRMSFGIAGKGITGGIWQSDPKPHIPHSRKQYTAMYEVVFKVMGFTFLGEFLNDSKTGNVFWFISPKTTEIKKNTRIITDEFSTEQLSTQGLIALNANEQLAFGYIRKKKVCYSDNLTGTEFEQALKNL